MVYPNPASQNLCVKAQLKSDVCIFNLLGRKVKSLKTSPRISVINISNLQHGLYIMRIQTKNKLISKQITINLQLNKRQEKKSNKLI
jgi:hypothetical protein